MDFLKSYVMESILDTHLEEEKHFSKE